MSQGVPRFEAKSMLDASLGEFRRQLEYKPLWNRKHLAVMDRWFPSTKACQSVAASMMR